MKLLDQTNLARKQREKTRKRGWLRWVLALIVFILINGLVVLLEPYFFDIYGYKQHGQLDRLNLYYKQPRPDVLLMGSSLTLTGFDPVVIDKVVSQQTGRSIKTLNLGISGSSLNVNYLILKNIISDQKKPEVIVYGLADFEVMWLNRTQTKNKANFSWIPYANLLLRPGDMDDNTKDDFPDKAEFLLNQFIPLYRDQQLMLDSLGIQFDPSNLHHKDFEPGPLQYKMPPNGFSNTNTATTLDPATYQQHLEALKSQVKSYSINTADDYYLKLFLQEASARNIKVVLVAMPASKDLLNLWPDRPALNSYLNTIKRVADQYNAKLVDLYENNDKLFTRDDYYDPNHLSASGAVKISQLIAQNYLPAYFKPGEDSDYYRAAFSSPNLPTRLPGDTVLRNSISVNVTNNSKSTWISTGANPVYLTYHWYDEKSNPVIYSDLRTRLTTDIEPGKSQDVMLMLRTPAKPGYYILELDLVREGVAWFSNKNNPVLRKPVIIYPRDANA